MITQRTELISQKVVDHLRIVLKPTPLEKGDGDYEIGKESLKRDLRHSLKALTGIEL